MKPLAELITKHLSSTVEILAAVVIAISLCTAKTNKYPPALIIIAQMIMGALTGGWGSSSGDASNGNCYYIGTGTLYKREG